jgi:NADH-quinone oxidoreductase subunit C
MTSRELARQLRLRFGSVVAAPVEFRDEVTLTLTDAERLGEVCTHAKRTLKFDFLLDITSVDNYGEDPRWTVVYELYSLIHRCHLRLKTNVSEEKSELPSVTKVWATANWHEREIYDLMGLRFRWHPDLRRIIMWEGYPYHPLRKDFPLAGKPTELPDIAFTRPAPLEGGPFMTAPGGKDTIEREPRSRTPAA